MHFKNFVEYDKQYSFLNKYAKKFKSELAHKNSLIKRPTHFVINNSSALNASVFVGDLHSFGDVIYLTQKDFKTLNKDDLRALLSHEIGHIYYGIASHLFISMLEVISSFCLFSCSLLVACIFYTTVYMLFIFIGYLTNLTATLANQIYPPLLYLNIFIISLFVLLFIAIGLHSLVGRHNEKIADQVGARLVGKKKYIHMLKLFRDFEKNELKNDEIMAKKLHFCPRACFRCLLILFNLHIKQNLSIIHPSWRKRIKAVRKLRIKS